MQALRKLQSAAAATARELSASAMAEARDGLQAVSGRSACTWQASGSVVWPAAGAGSPCARPTSASRLPPPPARTADSAARPWPQGSSLARQATKSVQRIASR